MNEKTLEGAYAHCQQICRDSSTTFFSSFSALENERRRAVHAVYALCRLVDDIVDGDKEPIVNATEELIQQTHERNALLGEIHSGLETANPPEVHLKRLMALVSIRNDLKRASLGEITDKDQPIFIALQDVFKRYPIRLHEFETVIEGMEDDLYPVQSNTWDGLRSYCYKVASAVGLILIEIYLEFDTNHIILETEAHVPSAFFKYISFPDGSKKCYYFPNITPDKVWQEYEIDCS